MFHVYYLYIILESQSLQGIWSEDSIQIPTDQEFNGNDKERFYIQNDVNQKTEANHFINSQKLDCLGQCIGPNPSKG